MSSRKNRILVAVFILMALIGAVTSVVYAYLSATTGSVENTFTHAPEHDISIKETFPGEGTNPVKENVCVDVGNPGYAVFVRANIIVTWQKNVDGKTSIYSKMPVGGTAGTAGIDYVLNCNQADWFLGSDGFYYLRTMVTKDETEPLINQCYQCQAGPEGYTLHVEIIAQTIQAKGSTDADGIPAVESAWKVVKVNPDGTLSKKEN